MPKTISLPFSPEDVRAGKVTDDWKCSGCGVPSPGRRRVCQCPTSVVYRGAAPNLTSAWKLPSAILFDDACLDLARHFLNDCPAINTLENATRLAQEIQRVVEDEITVIEKEN